MVAAPLSLVLASLLVMLGAFCGNVLAVLLKEETAWKPGKKYFAMGIVVAALLLMRGVIVVGRGSSAPLSLSVLLSSLFLFLLVSLSLWRYSSLLPIGVGLAAGTGVMAAARSSSGTPGMALSIIAAGFMVLLLGAGLPLSGSTKKKLSWQLARKQTALQSGLYLAGWLVGISIIAMAG
ncbi:hypothetical protein AUJ68_02585 [Candidatus Woesearchaeota archaeon CG1_02_57_44]|nr:MAG: hypothetical protein AUJ68_02585 [Candidatus Woesearchaeota archaeon CG1_02_57_44]PIN68298.1 MAG: hypothetical protein COV94_05440 [Candidatus Woesearchaeota archaeon CG11_big_fil_rev_8_21_14_0_20_57_5]